MKKLFWLPVCVALIFMCGACASSGGTGRVPDLSFEGVLPLYVGTARLDVVSPSVPEDSKDVSAQYPVAPAEALRRYAQRRLIPGGTADTLRFVIERAAVYHDIVEPENSIGRLLQVGRQDEYEISIALRLYTVSDAGAVEGPHSTLTFKRSTTMPISLSLAEREQRQKEFLETFILDIDAAVTRTLREGMRIAQP